ncbi:MAG: phosphopentomutase [Armatimonadetes bacterium]|nr:phosphopentomutase [Armatimonadota bacterium]
MRRVIVLVLDGCGAGAAPDAAQFGDGPGVATVKNVWDHVGGFSAPNLERLGFLAACGIGEAPQGCYGRLREISQGKDSVTGHWEMMGIISSEPFPTYPNGFPAELIDPYVRETGREILGNKPASGTAIIEELGAESMATGKPIVYTSADSVFQIAAHEDVIPIEELYEMCRIARRLCVAPHNVQRVIARPFLGEPGNFTRTERRKDFPLIAPPNLVDEIGSVFGIGVIPELFDGRGFLPVRRTQSNPEHAKMLLNEAMPSDARFIFANFEDFDMLYGHRSNPEGFAKCLEEFDVTLGQVLDALTPGDLLIITADHGNDPTDTSTDHTREYVPVVMYEDGIAPKKLGDIEGMTAIGATVAEHLGLKWDMGHSLFDC